MTWIMNSDQSPKAMHLYHQLNLALCAAVPVALLLSPSVLNTPVDLAMGVAIPVHFLFGGHGVVTDYFKKVPWFWGGAGREAFVRAGRVGLVAMAGATMLGLLKLNLQGPGLTEAVKELWRSKPEGHAEGKAASKQYLPGFLHW